MTLSLTEKLGNSRFTMFPIKHKEVWEMYKLHMSKFWTVEEIDLQDDIKDWNNKLNDNERYFIKNILAFFAVSDGIVLENLLTRFTNEIQIPEIKCFYTFQAMIENIHGECYSLLIDTYITDDIEKNQLFNAIDNIPSVAEKAKWAMKWMGKDNKSTFATRLVAFAVVEGIFFSGSFCSIFWLKSRGLMPGLCFSNELISRDEKLHTDFACLLYNKYTVEDRLSTEVINKIIREAVEIEINFINNSIPCKLIGMNKDLMGQYIKYVADFLLSQLRHDKIYNVKNPFKFMELISIERKSNFFEGRVSEYNLNNELNRDFEITEDF